MLIINRYYLVVKVFLFISFYSDFNFAASQSIERDTTTTTDAAIQLVGKIRASADLAFSKGDVDQALKLLTKVIELEPKNEMNFYKRFRIYLKQSKYREALADLNSALNIKSDDINILNQRAKLSMRLGKCQDSANDYTTLARYTYKITLINILLYMYILSIIYFLYSYTYMYTCSKYTDTGSVLPLSTPPPKAMQTVVYII